MSDGSAMRFAAHLRTFVVLALLCAASSDLARAGQSPVQDGPGGEAVAVQLREGATIPLVLKVLRRPVQAPQADTAPHDVAGVKRIAREAAAAHSVPVDYFLRLIKQESGFNHRAVSRAGAQGIAQFMPGTAAVRGLKNPFDPAEALPKSAAFLRDLTRQFGNIGLAAAAYTGGPTRVANWLAGRGGLPMETRSYVLAITGRTAEEWAPPGAKLLGGDTRSGILRKEAAMRASAYKAKNWELELLESLTNRTTPIQTGESPAGSKFANLMSSARSGKRVTRVSTTMAERALCPSCLIQGSY